MSTVAALQGRYITVLTDSLGLPAEASHDAVMFRDEDDRRYLLRTIPSSPHMLLLSSTYLETADLATTLHAASVVNQTRKLVKVAIRPTQAVVFCIEQPVAAEGCLPDPRILTGLLPRVIEVIRGAVTAYATARTSGS